MSPTREPASGYAAEVARLLWPEPWQDPHLTRARHRPAHERRDFYVFPSAGRPRVLVPASLRGSGSMLGRLGKGRTLLARTARSGLVGVVGSPGFALMRWPMLRVEITGGQAAESIEGYLSSALGVEVRVGVILGTPRANQKPVLQVFSHDGRTLGYAKIGHNEVTKPLVRREAGTLAALGRHTTTSLRTPPLLHHGQWRGLEVLVMSALTGTSGLGVSENARVAAMREVATLNGTVRSALVESGFWRRLQAGAAEVADETTRVRLLSAMSRISHRWGEVEVELGCWHGDWGYWNMAATEDRVQVWDWERFDTEVPLGFDGLHHRAQRVRPMNRDVAEQERLFLESAPDILAAFGVPADLVTLTLVLYQLEMGVRYGTSLNYAQITPLRRRTAWAVGLLEGQLAAEPALEDSEGARP